MQSLRGEVLRAQRAMDALMREHPRSEYDRYVWGHKLGEILSRLEHVRQEAMARVLERASRGMSGEHKAVGGG